MSIVHIKAYANIRYNITVEYFTLKRHSLSPYHQQLTIQSTAS